MSVEHQVKNIVIKTLGIDAAEAIPDADFVYDLGADSLDRVELLMDIEERFGIEIDDDDADKVRTVADAIALVTRLVEEKAFA